MSVKVQVVPVTQYQQNCSIIQCQATGLAAIVDPGGDIERIEAAVSAMGATVEKILLTHGHMDHCAAADALARCRMEGKLGRSSHSKGRLRNVRGSHSWQCD